MVARSNSVSKYSATRSATAIGPQRSSRYISFLPRLRIERPVCSMPHKSPRFGLSMFGGASSERFADYLAHFGQRCLQFRILGSVFLGEFGDLLHAIYSASL